MTYASPCKLPAALPQLRPVIPPAKHSPLLMFLHSPLPLPMRMALPLCKTASPHHGRGRGRDFASVLGHRNSFWLCCGCALSWLRVKSWLDSMHCLNVGGGAVISKGRKGSPLILNVILHNQARLCQPSDQSKEN